MYTFCVSYFRLFLYFNLLFSQLQSFFNFHLLCCCLNLMIFNSVLSIKLIGDLFRRDREGNRHTFQDKVLKVTVVFTTVCEFFNYYFLS